MLPPESSTGGAGPDQPAQPERTLAAASTPAAGAAATEIESAGQGSGAGLAGQAEVPGRGDLTAPPRSAAEPGAAWRAGPMGTALAQVGTVAGRAVAPVTRTWRRLRPPALAGSATRVRPADVAGSVLARLTVLPTLLIMAWLIPGIPLLLGGDFLPVPMLLISVPLAAALTVNGLRVVPANWPKLVPRGRPTDSGWTAWFGLLGTVAIVAGLIGWQLAESSQALIVARDPGTYLQTGYWIAQHGSLPIPESVRAFGGAHPGLNFTSIGFLARDSSLYPAVMPGLPLVLAGGFWVHGVTAASAIGPILGGLAALAFAGLVARLVGLQWAPAGALLLGLSLPQQYVGRTSLSETTLQIVLFGGLCLLVDSVVLRGVPAVIRRRAAAAPSARSREAGWPRSAVARVAAWRQLVASGRWVAWFTPQRVLAGLAGLALGISLTISLSGLVYLLAVIPFCCVLLIGRRPQAAPFLAGTVFGVCYGILGMYLLDRPLLDTVGQTVALAGVVAVWLTALSVVAFQLARLSSVRRAVPRLLARKPLRWLPEAGSLLAVAVLIGFAIRPYVQTVHGRPSVAVSDFIRSLQRLQGLPVDPTRVYSEQTLYWVIWYIGLPTVLLGGFGLAVLVRRSLRALITWRDPARVWRAWGLPLAVISAGVVVLWAPDIVPDQPWASRRLVVIVIPGLIITGLWAAAWLARRARDRGARPVTAAVAGLFCTAAMLVPTVSTTFGVGLSHSGKSGGLAPVAQGTALERTGAGQINAVRTLCTLIPHNASVVIVDWPTAQQFTQVIRGMCGVPVAWMVGKPVTAVGGVIASIAAAGRQPVVLASRPGRLAGFGGVPVRVLSLVTNGDPRQLTQLPTSVTRVRYQIWMTAPARSGVGT